MFSAERHFVKTAHDQMQILESYFGAESLPGISGGDDKPISKAFAQIKDSACTVQARGVYRAAALCEDIFCRLGTDSAAKIGTVLLGLKTLIAQYSEGLFEIDPEFIAILENGSAIDESVPEAGMGTLEQAQQNAAETLKPLLRLVKSDSKLSALGQLMDGVKNHKAQARGLVSLEALMRPVTNLTLSEARYNGKNVSLSYAADFDDLEADIADYIQNFLEILCLNIVSNGTAENASQISLTGQRQEQNMKFTVMWHGRNIAQSAQTQSHFRRAIKALSLEGGSIKFHEPALSARGNASQSLEIYFPQKLAAVNQITSLKSQMKLQQSESA